MRTFQEINADVLHAVRMSDAYQLDLLAAELDAFDTPQARALAHHSRGETLYLHGKYESALEYYHETLAQYVDLGDQRGEARISIDIGIVHINTGDYPATLEWYHRARALYEALGERSGVAVVTGNIGVVHANTGDYPAALDHYHRALAIHDELGDRSNVAGTSSNIGVVYANTGDYPAALDHYNRALAILEDLGARSGVATVLGNIGNVYVTVGDYPAALDHHHRALQIYEEVGDLAGMARVIGNIGNVHNSTRNTAAALEHFHRALKLHEDLGERGGIATVTGNIGHVLSNDGDHEAALDHFRRALSLHEVLGERDSVALVTGNILSTLVTIGSDKEAREILQVMDSISIDDPGTRNNREVQRAILQQREGDLDGAASTLQIALTEALDLGLRLNAAEVTKALRDLAQHRNDLPGYIEHNNEFLRITEEINGKDTATKLAMQTKQREIDAERKEHEKQLAVLHSTLPKHIADRVARGEVVNDHFEGATVIFLDIVGFTEISSAMSSQEVIDMLDDVFTQCDAICANHGVTKIKTIGDSYMCVSFDNVVNAALCALEMSRIHLSHEVSHEVAFRIGMHCGPVTAGVIGKERMQYDVWGDTVNVASRMESSGEAGRVHISEAFASELKRNTESHEVSHAVYHNVSHESVPQSELVTRHSSLVTQLRGSIDIKGKGPMQTYWLESA